MKRDRTRLSSTTSDGRRRHRLLAALLLAAIVPPAAAAPPVAPAPKAAYELGGFAGGVRIGVDLEPAALRALGRQSGSGVFAVWITTGFFEVVDRQPRLQRAELLRASDGQLQAVFFGVELLRAGTTGDRDRSDRRRYLVRYQRLDTPAPVR